MDRNDKAPDFVQSSKVALRKESVDRNNYTDADKDIDIVSLSARRAWIEIRAAMWAWFSGASLSARRAWIEILRLCWAGKRNQSLSARRAWIEIT